MKSPLEKVNHKNMQYPMLETKLFIPQEQPSQVLRPHLIERLNNGIENKLTLVSAPAGFGKTSLVCSWLAKNKMPACWISLDNSDNDPIKFLHYFIAAIRTFNESFGQDALSLLKSPQPDLEAIAPTIVREIMDISGRFILVLDDYHSIETMAVHSIVEFLLENQPGQLHLVLTTRADPPLPFARLRVRNQLTEIRATDLSFSVNETSEFLNELMNLNLSNKDITILESRTEGWIAGLQLAALSLQGRDNIAQFVDSFAGDNRHIVDYLAEEVLNLQSEPIQGFLLQTSILERFSASLCDFITNKKGSQKVLDRLEKTNLFIIHLDDKRQWYRYHHLFADLLRQKLQQRENLSISELHIRASIWYEKNNLEIEAFDHAIAAQNFARAADILEPIWPEMDGRFQAPAWLRMAKKLPDSLFIYRPVLCVAYALALLSNGDFEGATNRLKDAERALNLLDKKAQTAAPDNTMIIVDNKQFQSLPASIASAQSYNAQAHGNIQDTKKYAQHALDLLPEEDFAGRGPAAALLGLAYWTLGDLEKAFQALSDAMDGFRKAGQVIFALSGTYGMADIRIAQGRLQDAFSVYEQSLQFSEEQDDTGLIGIADIYLGLSGLYLEQGNSVAAKEALIKSETLGEKAALADWPYRHSLLKAQIKQSEGDLLGALDSLSEADRYYFKSPVPDVRPVKAYQAQIWITQNKLDKARKWAKDSGLSPKDDLCFLHEFEHLTLARLFIADYKYNKNPDSISVATELLLRLLKEANKKNRSGSIIEILIIQAIAYTLKENILFAKSAIIQALHLAEPEGYVRIFIDEGEPIARILEMLLEENINVSVLYVRKLLSTFSLSDFKKVPVGMIDALSERELDVLKLLSIGYSNKKITEELFISLSTVKTHIRNLFAKLNVHSRTQVIVKAKELELL